MGNSIPVAVAMKCTEQQYKDDLKSKLEKIGYVEYNPKTHGVLHIFQTNFAINVPKSMGFGDLDDVYKKEKIELIQEYNPEKFIKIASSKENLEYLKKINNKSK